MKNPFANYARLFKKDGHSIKNPFAHYARFFTENEFFGKMGRYARRVGLKTVYTALLLFFAFRRKETPVWAKHIIIGVLGYFIAPIDAIPDLSPIIGYTDDIGVLSFGLVTIACYVNDEVRISARKKLKDWFGDFDPVELIDVDNKI